RILTAYHMDDVATAEVTPKTGPDDRQFGFAVTLTVERDGAPVKAVTSKVRVVLRLDERGGPVAPAPDAVARCVVPVLGDPAALPLETAAIDSTALSAGRGTGTDPVLAELTAGRNAFGWKWRAPYFYCHFTERVQMSGYLRQMEEVVDLFL